MHPDDQLLVILVWEWHLGRCGVQHLWEGLKWNQGTLGMTSGMEGWSIIEGGCKHVDRCACR